jgi:hypothetical protein
MEPESHRQKKPRPPRSLARRNETFSWICVLCPTEVAPWLILGKTKDGKRTERKVMRESPAKGFLSIRATRTLNDLEITEKGRKAPAPQITAAGSHCGVQ